MKTLIITRHAKAVPGTGNEPDIMRKLAPRGYKDIKIIALELVKHDLVPGLIVSSPAVRTVETARHLAAHFDEHTIPVITRDSLYMDFPDEIFGFIESLCPEEKTVMVVGHNPDVMDKVEQLSEVDLDSFPTSATAVIDFDTESWARLPGILGKLRRLFIPKELRD